MSKNSRLKSLSAAETSVRPSSGADGFCRGIATLASGIAFRGLTASNENPQKTAVFSNKSSDAPSEFPARGKYLIAPWGEHPNVAGMQLVDSAAAAALKRSVNVAWMRVGSLVRFGCAIPVFRGHPDEPVCALNDSESADKTVYGKVTGLEAGARGIYASVAWDSSACARLPRGLRFSARWGMDALSAGRNRPSVLLSLGLTKFPNIPGVDAANSARAAKKLSSNTNQGNKKMNKDMLLKLGFTDAQADSYLAGAEGAPSEDEVIAAFDKLYNRAIEAEGGESDEAKKKAAAEKAKAAQNSAKKVAVENTLKLAQNSGRLTPAEVEGARKTLEDAEDIEAACNALMAKPAKFKAAFKSDAVAANAAASPRAKFLAVVAQNKTGGLDYQKAYVKAKKENSALFNAAFPKG